VCCVYVWVLTPGGRLLGGRVARFGRVVECFGFIEPMKIEVGCTLFTFLRSGLMHSLEYVVDGLVC
jgi:hypothetical protein